MKVVVLASNDPFLDGEPEEFPHREAAMAEYRALWIGFLMGQVEPNYVGDKPGPTADARARMDELQPLISRGPGRVWREFADSLPGFQEWWGDTASRLEAGITVKLDSSRDE